MTVSVSLWNRPVINLAHSANRLSKHANESRP